MNGYDKEIFFGVIGAIGTDNEKITKFLINFLETEVNYQTCFVKLSDFISEYISKNNNEEFEKSPPWERYNMLMTIGNEFREKNRRQYILSLFGIERILKEREKLTGDKKIPSKRTAYIVRSIKRPEEIKKFREVYREKFFLIGVYSSKKKRKEYLFNKFMKLQSAFSDGTREAEIRGEVEKLIARDEKEKDNPYGQRVSEAFPLSDFFINSNGVEEDIKKEIKRFVDIIFGYPYHTPTQHENGMFLAKSAALRSASLSRQVGAVITNEGGDIISLGTNEVPKYGGGVYRVEDDYDKRDFRLKYDQSDKFKKDALKQTLATLKEHDWLDAKVIEKFGNDLNKILEEALYGNPNLKESPAMKAIEYGRCVHAEMDAITSAGRQGLSLKNTILYSTTFPCHLCAMHIISSGIVEVYYIEPYPKSLVGKLHSDSISIEKLENNKVSFIPFIGISPNRFIEFFSFDEKRKEKDGSIKEWEDIKLYSTPKCCLNDYNYMVSEGLTYEEFKKIQEDLKKI